MFLQKEAKLVLQKKNVISPACQIFSLVGNVASKFYTPFFLSLSKNQVVYYCYLFICMMTNL